MGLAEEVNEKAQQQKLDSERKAQKCKDGAPAFLTELFNYAMKGKLTKEGMAGALLKGDDIIFISTRFAKGFLKGMLGNKAREFGEIPSDIITQTLGSHPLGQEIDKAGLRVVDTRHNTKIFDYIVIELSRK